MNFFWNVIWAQWPSHKSQHNSFWICFLFLLLCVCKKRSHVNSTKNMDSVFFLLIKTKCLTSIKWPILPFDCDSGSLGNQYRELPKSSKQRFGCFSEHTSQHFTHILVGNVIWFFFGTYCDVITKYSLQQQKNEKQTRFANKICSTASGFSFRAIKEKKSDSH